METRYRIVGEANGGLWWPIGEPAWKPVDARYARIGHGGPFVPEVASLREMVEDLTTREGGDFSTACKLSGYLVVEHIGANRRTERWFDLSALPSIADYIGEAEAA